MSLHEFISMNGYGLYVWPAYSITLIVFFINIVLAYYEKKEIKKHIRKYLNNP